MSNPIQFKKGEMFLTSEGEYSDYNLGSLYKVLIDFEIKSTLRAWALIAGVQLNSEGYPNAYDTAFSSSSYENQLFEWMVETKVIAKIEHRELHLGDYGDNDFQEYTPAPVV